MTKPTKISATHQNGITEVRILMQHNMDNGRSKDAAGKPVPLHFITEFLVTWNEKPVLEGEFGPSISKNPYLNFSFTGGTKGDKISITWKDNQGNSRTDVGQIT